MKATSSTAKPRGSTSASPWWTSLRSASGYQRWRSKACWRRRRGKKRVSLASWPVHAQQAFPVLPLTPSRSSFLSTTPTVLISPPFSHHPIFIWSPGIRMLKPRLPFRLRTDLPTPKGPPTTRCLEYSFNRSPLQSRTDLLLKCSREKIRSLANSEAAKEKEALRGYSLLGSVHSWRTRGSARNAGFSPTVSEAVWIPRTVIYF